MVGLTLGYYGLIAQGVSTIFNAFSAKSVAKYSNAIAQAQADIARINAKTMELHYQNALFAAESEYQHETMRAGQAKAQQEVAIAANGIAMGVGSAAEMRASTDIVKKVNLNRLETNKKAEAWGYRTKAVDYENEALMSEAKKQSANSVFANTLLQGAANTAFWWAAGQLDAKLSSTGAKTKANKTIKVDAVSAESPAIGSNTLLLSGQNVQFSKMYSSYNDKYSLLYGAR